MSHDLVELYFGRRMGPQFEPIVLKFQEDLPASTGNWGKHLVMLGLSNVGGQIARDVMTRLEIVRGVEYSGTSFYGDVVAGPPGGIEHLDGAACGAEAPVTNHR